MYVHTQLQTVTLIPSTCWSTFVTRMQLIHHDVCMPGIKVNRWEVIIYSQQKCIPWKCWMLYINPNVTTQSPDMSMYYCIPLTYHPCKRGFPSVSYTAACLEGTDASSQIGLCSSSICTTLTQRHSIRTCKVLTVLELIHIIKEM